MNLTPMEIRLLRRCGYSPSSRRDKRRFRKLKRYARENDISIIKAAYQKRGKEYKEWYLERLEVGNILGIRRDNYFKSKKMKGGFFLSTVVKVEYRKGPHKAGGRVIGYLPFRDSFLLDNVLVDEIQIPEVGTHIEFHYKDFKFLFKKENVFTTKKEKMEMEVELLKEELERKNTPYRVKKLREKIEKWESWGDP